jgi:hypothetical protein
MMTVNTIGCVLPPPPLEHIESEDPLAVDYNLLAPPDLSPLQVERRFDAPKLQFSVKGAIPEEAKVYWFVDYQEEDGIAPDAVGSFMLLSPCDTELLDGDPKTVLVEALIAEGELALAEGENILEPRTAADGGQLLKVTWTLIVSGPNQQCIPPNG